MLTEFRNMDRVAEKIKRSLDISRLRDRLGSYFEMKGFEYEDSIYPPALQDLWHVIPEVATKVEINPFVKELNPVTGVVTIGWNLFVLGTQRMYLGWSTHQTLEDLMRGVSGNTMGMPSESDATPSSIIDFVVRVLGTSESGSSPADTVSPMKSVSHISGFEAPWGQSPTTRPFVGPKSTGSYYEKNKPVY